MSEPSKPASDQGAGEPASGVARSWAASGEQTLLGVAPPIALPPLAKPAEPAPPAPPSPPRPASSGAIAATRMISVSDAAPVTPPAASPAPTASPVATAAPARTPTAGADDAPRFVSVPAQAPPQRPASIGGWQSAGPAMTYQAPSLIETLTSMRSPLADAPPNIIDAAPTVPDATPIFAEPAPVAQQASAPEPQQASAPEPQQPAGAVAGAAVGGWQPVMHTVPIPIARDGSPPPPEPPPAPSPEAFASTALSNDYLRAARDVVRAERDAARAEARPMQPDVAAPLPTGDALANAATLQFESVPPVRAPLAEQPPVTALPISVSLSSSWQRPEGPHSATMPLGAQRTTFPSWRMLVLVAISVLALIAIAAAAFVAVRRFAEASSATSELRLQPLPRVERAPNAASDPVTASGDRSSSDGSGSDRSNADEAALGARAARLVLLGRHDDARPLYAELARKNPGAPAYAALERILDRTRGLGR